MLVAQTKQFLSLVSNLHTKRENYILGKKYFVAKDIKIQGLHHKAFAEMTRTELHTQGMHWYFLTRGRGEIVLIAKSSVLGGILVQISKAGSAKRKQ